MKFPLLYKFSIMYICSAIAGIVILIFASQFMSTLLIRRQAELLSETTALIREEYYTDYFNPEVPINSQISVSFNNLGRLMESISNSTGAAVWIINDINDIILSKPSASRGSHVNNFSIDDFNKYNYQTGTFYDFFDYEVLSVYSSVRLRSGRDAYIILHFPLSYVIGSNSSIMNFLYIICGIIYLVPIALLILFYMLVIRPIRKINNAAAQYSIGNFGYPGLETIKSNDELGSLAGSMKVMAQSLKEREESESRFIVNVAHDLRSPLTSIKGYAAALRDGTIDWEDKDQFLDIIVDETNRLDEITFSYLARQSLDLDMSERSKIEAFDIADVLNHVFDLFAGRAETKGIVLKKNYDGDSIIVYGRRIMLTQAIYNIVSNAIKYTDKGGNVTISLKDGKEKAVISVKDTGIGIPADKQRAVWDRFYKGDSSRGLDRESFGIGLSIVREIIELHGESINLVSEEGRGTEFTFTLPKNPPI